MFSWSPSGSLRSKNDLPRDTLKTVKDAADQLIAHSLGPIARAPFEYLMSRAKSIFAVLKTRSSSRALTTEKTDAAFDLQLVNLSMSGLSSLLYAHFDASKIEAQRRANFAFLRRELSSLPGLRFLYSELPAGVCPWVFPVIFGEQQDACQALRAEHIPASNWDGVRPLDLPLGAFPDADFLYRNLVFLPVHQNLTTEDLQQIVQTVTHILTVSTPVTSPLAHDDASAAVPSDDAHPEEILRQGSN